jgi:peptidyl-prolyl cis-trans isomerase B (cyclophilin B)
MFAAGCGGSPEPEAPPPSEPAASAPPAQEPPPTEQPAAQPETTTPPPAETKPAPQAKQQPAGNPVVAMETSKGTIRIELYPDKAPETVANFLQYVDDGFYNGTIFHRVKKGFMIQGGGMTADMNEKPTRGPIKNESTNGLPNLRGTIAMARIPQPHSATAQFFINHGSNNSFLNKNEAADGWGYCVFGQITQGMDVVDAIAGVATTSKMGHDDVPVEPVVIKSARRVSGSAS